MTSVEPDESLWRLARRLQADPQFMSYALATYQQHEGLERQDLAQELGLAPEMLLRLALCRRPDPDSPLFAEQVREIADYTLMDEARLANILRQVSSLEKLAQRKLVPDAPETESQPDYSLSGLLAAARDRNVAEAEEISSPADQSPPEE